MRNVIIALVLVCLSVPACYGQDCVNGVCGIRGPRGVAASAGCACEGCDCEGRSGRRGPARRAGRFLARLFCR